MVVNKYSVLTSELENEELECISLTPENYSQLFAAYLYQDRLTDAKHLWLRIPATIKNENSELAQLQMLSQELQKNSFAEFFTKVKYEWSDKIKHIITDLLLKTREDVLHLTGFAYSSIYEQNLLNMTQLSPDELRNTCANLGWSNENDGQQNIILPKPQPKKSCANTDDQLFKLTEFVSFLEN